MRAAIVVLALALFGCGEAEVSAHREQAAVWVLAPHPDDEALMAAEPILRAVGAGDAVFVHVMTNGDLGCERDGWARQDETVRAMSVLGLPEERIRFLGYPDGHLAELGPRALPLLPRRLPDGGCGAGNTTYARRGEHHADVHSARTGAPGQYLAASAIEDLVELLERERPRAIYVSHPIDDHPDHATTYLLLRRALERASLPELPRVHRALVHAGGCWPNGSATHEPCPSADNGLGTPYPPLPGPLEAYMPNDHLPVRDGGALARLAIGSYRSQLHTDVDHDWLGTFARGESIYWSETLSRENGRVVRASVLRGRSELTARDASSWIGAHEPPLELTFSANLVAAEAARVRILARTDAPETGYEIAIEDREGTVALELRRGRDTLRRLALPPGTAVRQWSLRLDLRPDDSRNAAEPVLEISVRADGELMGVIVDPRPVRNGDLLVADPSGVLESLTIAPLVPQEDGARP